MNLKLKTENLKQKLLLAVSGGRDSVAMTDLVHRAGITFAIAHCNFNLRPGDCDRDQLFVRRLAQSYNVPFFTTSFDTQAFAASNGLSIEDAARQLRYGYFAELCQHHGYSCVATAHHRDDSIETFFLNLFRGTGISGLHGIRPSSVITINGLQVEVIRPLLDFSRADIDAYIMERGLEYVEDHTNYELDARRNRIRHQLMPLLRDLYPSIDTTMQANIERLHDTELIFKAYIDELRSRFVCPYVPVLPMLRGNNVFGAVEIDVCRLEENLKHKTPSLLFELLRPYGFNAAVSADLFRSLDAQSGTQFHSPTHTAELHRGRIIIAPKAVSQTPSIMVESVPADMVQSEIAAVKQSNNQTILINTENVRQPFKVRPWHDGDRFRPFGMKGARLVSDFLKDLGLPLVERRHVYLLVDVDDTPLWVIGLRADDRTRVTHSCSSVLKVSCHLI